MMRVFMAWKQVFDSSSIIRVIFLRSHLTSRTHLRCLLSLCSLLFVSTLQAATPLVEYVHRVEAAEKLATDVAENDYGRTAEEEILQRIRLMLPTTEDIARDPQQRDVVHVDNAWLHQALSNLSEDDEPTRTAQLTDLAQRLTSLAQSLRPHSQPEASTATPEQLKQILQRPEYQPEEKKESAIQNWIRKIRNQISDFLLRLFGKSPAATPTDAPSFSGFQFIIVIVLIAVFIWALISILQRFMRREAQLKPENDTSIREILGEQFAADVTSDDLFKTAAELARKGEFRLAIRRAYIAALYDLELRGKLRLHQAKTNNDYLRELRHEQYLFPPLAQMTTMYERFWYGHTNATMEDYANLIEQYRAAGK